MASIPQESLEVLLAQHPGTVALTVERLDGEVLLDRAGTRVFPAASTIKVPLLIRALQHVQQGDLDLSQRFVVRAEDRVTGSGILRELGGDLQPTLRDLLTLMIVVSDNTATNLVIDRMGIDDVNAFLHEQALNDTELIGLLQLPEERGGARQRAGEYNHTSARDMAKLLQKLAGGALLSAELTKVALDIMTRQQHLDLIGRHVLTDEHGERLYRVASKSGALPGVRHDVGIVWTPEPLIIAVLSEAGRDPRYHPDNQEVQLLARVVLHLLIEFGGMAVSGVNPGNLAT